MAEQPEQQSPAPPRVSVIVVSHNRIARLRRCLETLEACEPREIFQVDVVDNGSIDGSAQLDDEFPKVRFIHLPKNFGLTKALNIGIRASDSELLLLLHEDTEVAPDSIRVLAEALDARPDAAIVCPLLTDSSGAPAPQLGSLPPDDTYYPATPGDAPAAVPYPRGAALMMRRFFFSAMRQIDERYGQFGSDADLAQQAARGNKKVLLVPAARVVHYGREQSNALRAADTRHGRSVWIGKYSGFASGMGATIGSGFSALVKFRLGELGNILSGQKIDGTQS